MLVEWLVHAWRFTDESHTLICENAVIGSPCASHGQGLFLPSPQQSSSRWDNRWLHTDAPLRTWRHSFRDKAFDALQNQLTRRAMLARSRFAEPTMQIARDRYSCERASTSHFQFGLRDLNKSN